jgi:transaldolase
MLKNPLLDLHVHGQSVWLDYLSRDLIQSGKLERLVLEDGLRGLTTNPTIFHVAITGSQTYDDEIRALSVADMSALEILETLAVRDIVAACDVLKGVYGTSGGADGFVSLEVSPHLAHDTDGTVDEARRLAAAVDRPNLMIKVPATDAGMPAIETLLTEGVNVNITLIFAQNVYGKVADTYLCALEARASQGQPLDTVASVASTFVSRIDTVVDAELTKLLEQSSADSEEARSLLGKVAIANSRVVYQMFTQIFSSERFEVLAAKGARPQRPLWASTSTKNPAYAPTLYIDELIGPDTVNTMPENSMDEFREHGQVESRLDDKMDYWREVLGRVESLGVDLNEVMQDLRVDGLKKFSDSYDDLLRDLTVKATSLVS